jgi:hypothetical protein
VALLLTQFIVHLGSQSNAAAATEGRRRYWGCGHVCVEGQGQGQGQGQGHRCPKQQAMGVAAHVRVPSGSGWLFVISNALWHTDRWPYNKCSCSDRVAVGCAVGEGVRLAKCKAATPPYPQPSSAGSRPNQSVCLVDGEASRRGDGCR